MRETLIIAFTVKWHVHFLSRAICANAVLTCFFVDAKISRRRRRHKRSVHSFIWLLLGGFKLSLHDLHWIEVIGVGKAEDDDGYLAARLSTVAFGCKCVLGAPYHSFAAEKVESSWGLLQWFFPAAVTSGSSSSSGSQLGSRYGNRLLYSRVIHSVNNWALSWTVAVGNCREDTKLAKYTIL